ncbi:twin-arginine translocation signal domain-containing protein [Streptomyces sp. S465]|uniref:twin-arginine translocation signal domain-containing protein n=1 Tax=Streptomyces sp. S465 TaxID=2979468 RepID=UPI0022A861F3|nr:twin-arginine translocation signal domain-containing protein [Streptomyces sp. S465]WAP56121.1 twin-arginine translocation signal domain-containing protein [Streptomyces sp. S465]
MSPSPSHVSRRHFLAGTAAVSALLATAGPQATAAARGRTDKPFLELLTKAADARVAEVLDGLDTVLDQLNNLGQARPAARSLRLLASVHVWADARHHHDGALIAPMTRLVDALAAAQFDDGLYDQGAVHSPPDTAFSIVDLGLLHGLLAADGHATTEGVRATLKKILLKAGEGLSTGGVHTPNHRWKVCAALARINSFWPDARYTRRIDAWLAEGIDQYDSGQYSERSATYAPIVTNPSLLTLARLTERPQLYDNVRRNLEATMHLLEPDGEVETVHSRRQDQKTVKHLSEYWLQFRALALREKDGRFAAVAAAVQRRGADQTFDETPLGDFLAEVLDHPEVAAPLPKATGEPGEFTFHDKDCGLVRIAKGNTRTTLFGGTDFPDVHAISSGLSTNPTFFKWRKGAAILDSLRLSPQFFSLGHFRAEDVARTADGWRLWAEVRAGYHLPLPPQHRRSDGRYPLTDDGRFWSAMDFPHRPKEWRTLRTEVRIAEADGGWNLDVEVGESEVPLALELCFRSGGRLTGVVPVSGQRDTYQLVEGYGTYTAGDDVITFGPGNGSGPRQPAVVDPGERYSWMGGELTPAGQRVLITGRAPLRYRLTLR